MTLTINQPFSRLLQLAWTSEFVHSLRVLAVNCLVALLDKLDHLTRRKTTVFSFPEPEQAYSYARSVLASVDCAPGCTLRAEAPRQSDRPTYIAPLAPDPARYYHLPTALFTAADGSTVCGLVVVDHESLKFAGIQTETHLVPHYHFCK